MRFKEFLQELDLKGAAKKSGLADIHAKQQQAKKDQFDAKYNTGMPVKIKLKVYVKKPSWTAQDPYEYKEFTIDNLIDIRHRLADVTLIDLATADDDKSKHDDKATFAIMKTNKHYTGSLPEYLHGLPARTRKKPGFGPYDLRREAWTDSPIVTNEATESLEYLQNTLAKQRMTMQTLKGYLRNAKTDETRAKHQENIAALQKHIDEVKEKIVQRKAANNLIHKVGRIGEPKK